MQTIKLHIYEKKFIPVLHAKQGDVGRKFKVIITDGTDGYTIPADVSFSVWYEGASGVGNYTHIGGESAIHVVDNMVIVEMIAQMLNNAGDGKLCLIMANADDDEIGTWNIPYSVEAVPGLGSKPAEQHLNALADAQKNAEDSAALAAQYADEALIQQENALLFATQAEESAKRAEAAAAQPNPVYELLETITIEEGSDVGVWNRDGLSLDAVLVKVACPAYSGTGKITISVGRGSYILGLSSQAVVSTTGSERHTVVGVRKDNGYWVFYNYIAATKDNNIAISTRERYFYATSVKTCPDINVVRVTNVEMSLPAGTAIKIYGVKRNEN